MKNNRNERIDLFRIIIYMNGYGKASEKIDAYSLKHFVA